MHLSPLCSLLLMGEFCAAAPADGVAAASARDFLNSIGMCTHIGQGIDKAEQSAEVLKYAGVRNIRDDGSPRHVPDWLAVHQKAEYQSRDASAS